MILFRKKEQLFLLNFHSSWSKRKTKVNSAVCTCDVIVCAKIKTDSSPLSLVIALKFHILGLQFEMSFSDFAAFVASGALVT